MSGLESTECGPPRGGLRFPALIWALLHVPLFLACYAGSIADAIQRTPPGYRLALAPTFLPQAGLLATLCWLVGLPLSLRPRLYRWGAPGLVGLATVAIALDSRVYQAVGFHLNGFFLRVLLQPNAIREAGVPHRDVATFLALAVLLLVAEVWLGGRFLQRFAADRWAWSWALLLIVLSAGERLYGGALTVYAGPAAFAASMVLPLQAPVRMEREVMDLLGRPMVDPFAGAGREAARLPAGIDPSAVKLARRPDVLVIVAESLPASHLDAATMPNLWRRAQEGGARFTRHYSGASSTSYSLFSLFYGLQARKLESIVGAGRRPVLFPALRQNGYQMRVSAASCVDWMGLRETVFGGVRPEELKTWCEGGAGDNRDQEMLADAQGFVDAADARPIFLFVFSFGTHFSYYSPPSAPAPFQPAWDGVGGVQGTQAAGWLIENRARNAAHLLDGWLEGFLTHFEAKRGQRPLLFFTGDHGEEFRQKGHIGHGSAVTDEQIHVPFMVTGDGVPRGSFDQVTSHADLVPTIFGLLGDGHPPELYSDGMNVFQAPSDRFVVSTVGWEPRYAVIGRDLKVAMYAGLTSEVTDPEDRPLPDGRARLAAHAAQVMRALRGADGSEPTARVEPGPQHAP